MERDCSKLSPESEQTLLASGEDIVIMMSCAVDLLALHSTERDLNEDARAGKLATQTYVVIPFYNLISALE